MQSGGHWERDSAWTLFRFPEAEFFESVELYFGDNLEKADHSFGTEIAWSLLR